MRILSPARVATLKSAAWVAAIPGACLFLWIQVTGYLRVDMVGVDSHAYWRAIREPETWYTLPPGYKDAFLYSPVFAQMLAPLGHLPWPAFELLWFVASAGVLGWLLAPLGWRRGLTIAPFLCTDLILGNVYAFFGAVLVLGLGRLPGALALPLLTKVAPGVVFLWFVVRREWKKAGWAAGFTLALVALSWALNPAGWLHWIQFLVTTSTGERGGTAGLRLVIAAAIVVWAARTNRAWLLAPALILACPVLGGFGPQSVLAAIPRLLQSSRSEVVDDAPAVPDLQRVAATA